MYRRSSDAAQGSIESTGRGDRPLLRVVRDKNAAESIAAPLLVSSLLRRKDAASPAGDMAR